MNRIQKLTFALLNPESSYIGKKIQKIALSHEKEIKSYAMLNLDDSLVQKIYAILEKIKNDKNNKIL